VTTAGVDIVRVDVKDILRTLDSFYCYNLVVMHWARAVANRLEGPARFLLTSELQEAAAGAPHAADELADRIGDLEGTVTADPTHFVDRSPITEFALPNSNSDVAVILGYALRHIRSIIGEYQTFLDQVRGKDDLSHHLVVGLLGQEVHHEAEITAALASAN
jgi:bacterioferritin